jgi:glycosyltransferase involved in cell wall biosynthesis
MKVALIATVLNEGDSIRPLMDTLVAQSRQPDEIILVDGGSTDHTVAVIQSYRGRLPLTVLERPGANISQGRNTAIAAADAEIIAVTDAGVRLHPEWLARLTAPFEADPATQVVAGFFLPDAHTPFEVAMGVTVLPEVRDIDPARFMPSSRSVAFHRQAFERAGRYPEWLDYCEDLILDFNLHRLVGAFAFAPDAVAYFRPRASLRAFFRQYFLYARGDGKANLFFRRHLIRYLTYLAALPLILFAGIFLSPWWLLALVAGAGYIVAAPYRRLARQWEGLKLSQRLAAVWWVPIIRVTGDIAKMIGYPVGWLWRLRHRPPDWRVEERQPPG